MYNICIKLLKEVILEISDILLNIVTSSHSLGQKHASYQTQLNPEKMVY